MAKYAFKAYLTYHLIVGISPLYDGSAAAWL